MKTVLGSMRGLFVQALGARRALLPMLYLCLVAVGSPIALSQPEGLDPATSPEPRTTSTWEQSWNAFGDPWSLKGRRNPSIPIGAGTTSYTILGPNAPEQPDDDELRYVGNSNGIYLYDDGAKLLQPGKDFVFQVPGRPDVTYSSSRVREYLARIRQVNPDLRYIGYLTPNELSGYYNGFDEILDAHPEWLVRDPRSGHPLQVVYDLGGGQSVLGEYLMEMGNADYRAFIAQKAAESMRYHGFGGVLLDHLSDRFNTGHAYNGTIPASYLTNWQDSVRETVEAIKQAAPELEIFLSPYDQDESFMRSLLDAGGDGYFFENPLGPAVRGFDFLAGSDRFGYPYTIDKIAFNRQAGKKVLISQSNLGPGTIGSASGNRNEALRRYTYYLALYMVFLYSQTTDVHYVYYTENLRGAEHFQDSDIRLGDTTGAAQDLERKRVWHREFPHGAIYVNLSNQPARINQRRQLYDARRTPHEGVITVPAQSGLILGEWDALPDPR